MNINKQYVIGIKIHLLDGNTLEIKSNDIKVANKLKTLFNTSLNKQIRRNKKFCKLTTRKWISHKEYEVEDKYSDNSLETNCFKAFCKEMNPKRVLNRQPQSIKKSTVNNIKWYLQELRAHLNILFKSFGFNLKKAIDYIVATIVSWVILKYYLINGNIFIALPVLNAHKVIVLLNNNIDVYNDFVKVTLSDGITTEDIGIADLLAFCRLVIKNSYVEPFDEKDIKKDNEIYNLNGLVISNVDKNFHLFVHDTDDNFNYKEEW